MTVFQAVLLMSSALLPAALSCAAAPADDDDLTTLTRRLCASLLPITPQTQSELCRQAARDGGALNADGSWPDVDYRDTTLSGWKTAEHLSRLKVMAEAYRIPRQPLQADPEFRAKIRRALSYWLDQDFQNHNWWWNQIGVPMTLGDVLLLMKQDITPAQKAKGIVILKRSVLGMSGANLTWMAENQIKRGCLADDPAAVQKAFTRLYAEIYVAPPGAEGIQADESFHQHGRQLYSGGYGASFAADCVRFTVFAWGTRFQIPPARLDILIDFLLDGQQWMMRGARFDYSAVGREITRVHPTSVPPYTVAGPDAAPVPAGDMPPTALGRLAALPVPRQTEMRTFARRASGQPDTAPLTGNRSFWCSDYMTHLRPGYLATLHLCSTRMRNGEVVNGEGLRSQYLSYGATLIYQTGNEYHDIFPVWDWRRIPGATIEQEPGPFDPHQVGVTGRTSFVGSASDGLYGLAVQDLALGPVTGHKAWFFFDAGFVALGAGLACPTDNPLLTSVNQCLLHGDVLVGGQSQPLPRGAQDLTGVHWVWHDGIGYAFPGGAEVHVADHPQTGRWSDIGTGSSAPVTEDVFSLWLDHGRRVTQGAYAYAVLPGCPAPEVACRADRLQIVQNTPEVQAVSDRSAGVLEAAFWQAGSVTAGTEWRVSVDQPCLFLLRRLPQGKMRLAVANPEDAPLTVNVTVNGTARRLSLPGGMAAGKSLVRDF